MLNMLGLNPQKIYKKLAPLITAALLMLALLWILTMLALTKYLMT
jgi:hypothetical protein